MSRTSRLDTFVVSYTRWVIRWRWPIVIATLLVALFIGSGARGLFFNTNYRAFFSDENPQLNAFEALQNIYTKNDNILFVVAPGDEEVFTPSTLDAIEHLERVLAEIDHVGRIGERPDAKPGRLADAVVLVERHHTETFDLERPVEDVRLHGRGIERLEHAAAIEDV